MQLILNGKAAGDPAVRDGVNRLRAEGLDVEVRVTWEGGDAERFADEAVARGVDVIVAGGGDGTLNAVVSGLLANGAPRLPSVGLLPLGTANDFARGYGIPAGDPFQALGIVVESQPVAFDVGRCGSRYFANVATGGFGTEITVGTRPELKAALGGAAYLLTGVANASSIAAKTAEFSAPAFEWEGRFLAMAVGNARFAGGGIEMCPGARVDDGLLDLWIVPEVPEAGVGQALQDLLAAGPQAIRLHSVHRQVSRLKVRAETELQVNLDGEPLASREFVFEAVPGRLRFHLPPDSPVLCAR